ncbi:MAG TPA: GNAT family N-acetyltransferase [Chloroflexi bacterium]|nr:GNAT family N-acetyltransferase [Chloroflexota bacterium]
MASQWTMSFIHTLEDMERLEPEWRELLSHSATRTPFQRHSYARVWWSTLGGGEWPQAELWLATARDSSGRLRGVAPLFFTENKAGRPALLLLGSVEISDYLDFIVSEEDSGAFATTLLEGLDARGPRGWELLELHNLPETSPTKQALQTAADGLGWSLAAERQDVCPVLQLGSSWDEYLDALESKQRHELRRKLRRAAKYPAKVTWRITGPEHDLNADVDTFLSLMAHDPKKRAFLTPAMREQFHRLAEVGWKEGWLQMAFLEVSDQPVFGYMNFDDSNRLWIYNSGIDPQHLKLSPGWVLMGHLIQWAIDQRREAIDFLRGDETYKYRLGGKERYVMHLAVERL